MKQTPIITLTIAIGVVLLQPISTFAKDDAQKKEGHEKGQAKQENAQGKGRGKAGNREQVSHQPQSHSPSGRSEVIASRPGNFRQGNASVAGSRASRFLPNQSVTESHANVTSLRSGNTARNLGVAPSRSRYSQQPGYSGRGGNATSFGDQRSYTRDNNYGGLWVHGDRHRDWDRNRVHSWNNHRYGWYEGGWLIIDSGYRPRGYYFSDYSAYSVDSTVRQVQRRLGAEGYPVGYADGVIGPATRNGIANYQSDNGLAVTGRINDPLLASLGLR